MSISTIATPQMERVRQLVEEAKTAPDGITVWLRVEKYGSLAACKSSARSLQTTFSSLRVRARRLAQRLKGETTEYLTSMTKGEYDDIACVVRPLPEASGYRVDFVPAYALDMDLEITDRATGEPLASEDPALNRFVMLFGKMFKEEAEAKRHGRKYLNPLSLEELQFMWAHDAEECERMNVPRPAEMRSDEEHRSVDLAELSDEELVMDQPGESNV